MGILESIRKNRAKTKADIKAAQVRARTETRESAKLDLKRAKLLAEQENNLLKAEQKGLKKKRKHQRKQAKTELEKIKAGKLNKDRVNRWLGAGRLLVPVLLPVAYKLATAGRERFTEARAKQLGVSADELAQFSGHGAPLKARLQGIHNTLEESDELSPGFVRDAEGRLQELGSAVDNAEYMTPEQRRRAHSSISRDIEVLVEQIQESLTHKRA